MFPFPGHSAAGSARSVPSTVVGVPFQRIFYSDDFHDFPRAFVVKVHISRQSKASKKAFGNAANRTQCAPLCCSEGVRVSMTFFEDAVVPKKEMQDPSVFLTESGQWEWSVLDIDEKYYLDVGDEVLMRVTDVRFCKPPTPAQVRVRALSHACMHACGRVCAFVCMCCVCWGGGVRACVRARVGVTVIEKGVPRGTGKPPPPRFADSGRQSGQLGPLSKFAGTLTSAFEGAGGWYGGDRSQAVRPPTAAVFH